MGDPTIVHVFSAPKEIEQNQLRSNFAIQYECSSLFWGTANDIDYLLFILAKKFSLEPTEPAIFIKGRETVGNMYMLYKVREDVAKAFFSLSEAELPKIAKAWSKRCEKKGSELFEEKPLDEKLLEFLKTVLCESRLEFEKGGNLYYWDAYF
jgi:hypothetical protein